MSEDSAVSWTSGSEGGDGAGLQSDKETCGSGKWRESEGGVGVVTFVWLYRTLHSMRPRACGDGR